MSKTTAIIVSIIILIILGVLAYFGYKNFQSDKEVPNKSATSSKVEVNADQVITAKHQYNGETGGHIVAGTIQTPTICDVLNTSVDVNSDTNVATVHFSLTNTSDTCAQAIGEQRFKVTFQAPEDAVIKATLEGVPVELSLIPVPEGEDLSDFQIYIKG